MILPNVHRTYAPYIEERSRMKIGHEFWFRRTNVAYRITRDYYTCGLSKLGIDCISITDSGLRFKSK